ncbi:prenyltransferase/squalene oxidase repeat-containing protein [Romboutsia lituseburensis]|uniref:prenyltransferase/squalene oxidase repeat-containing protein n=1 Tax=Romboutsia lituseburensis TaxID=1537 RepID=UPI00215B364C|nr:terpene cyclase/mutase family protein [Romboutsia lituseburensis]MCR8743800.1 terpene cyclase/mutase family protein [Romboutsia lituseburensis]
MNNKKYYSTIMMLSISLNILDPICVFANEQIIESTLNTNRNYSEESLDKNFKQEHLSNSIIMNDNAIIEKEEEFSDVVTTTSTIEESSNGENIETSFLAKTVDMIEISKHIKEASQSILNRVKNPSYGDEWSIFALARSGVTVPSGYYEKYYKNVEQVVKEKKGNLHRAKYTEYSRIIIALTSIGKDPSNVGGYNLVEKLYDYDNVSKQGINGTVFALIALDTKSFNIPESANNSREKMVEEIIHEQLYDGGFNLTSEKGDVDITAMAIQALAKYKDQKNVKESIDKALKFLSKAQLETGGFGTDEGETVESGAQVVIALNALGIEINNERFIKNGKNVMDSIIGFKASDGGFRHLLTQTSSNAMATEQAVHALASQYREMNLKTKLYDTSDIEIINNSNQDEDLNKNNENNSTLGNNSNNNHAINNERSNKAKINNQIPTNTIQIKNPKTSDSSILGYVGMLIFSIFGLVIVKIKNKNI